VTQSHPRCDPCYTLDMNEVARGLKTLNGEYSISYSSQSFLLKLKKLGFVDVDFTETINSTEMKDFETHLLFLPHKDMAERSR
jgi:hypothetical protein